MGLRVRCFCPKCKGARVARSTRADHDNTQNRARSYASFAGAPELPTASGSQQLPPLPMLPSIPLPFNAMVAPAYFATPTPATTGQLPSRITVNTQSPPWPPPTDYAFMFPVPATHLPGLRPLQDPTPASLPSQQPIAVTSPCAGSQTTAIGDSALPAKVRKLPKASQGRALAAMAAAEQRGRDAIKAAQALAGDYLPLGDDDWEDRSDEEDEDVLAGNTVIPAVAVEDDDIFRVASGPALPLPTASDVHPHPSAYILYLLVLWLHTALHLPFRGCNVVLVVVGQLLSAADVVINPPLLKTLPSVMDHLGAEPTFQILPACPTCFELFPSTSGPSTQCPRCAIPIFRPLPSSTRTPPKPKPYMSFPTKSIEEQLKDMLSVPGVEEEMDLWRAKARTPGIYEDFFDGRVSRDIEGPDGLPFFRHGDTPSTGPDNELRVGVTLGVDWFSYLRSQIAPSHTSGPMSFNVINFRSFLRYRTANLILRGIMPGPKEQDPDQVQRLLRVIVDELLRLWRDGIVVITPKYPLGRLLRLILVGVICDKPAAHKMGGFGSHSHQFFCTRCWIRQQDKTTPAAFERNGFRARTDTEHRQRQQEYLKCSTASARIAFVKMYGTRWCQLSRLPYFDLCRMIVIDPMHNLLLGLIKTHFYQIWVLHKVLRKTKEMRRFHALLAELHLPAFLGRLPGLMGVPAGGSLTADQWLVAAVVVCPMLIPQIWAEYLPVEVEDARIRRISNIQTDLAAKKLAAAAARKAKAEVAAAKKEAAALLAGQVHRDNPRPKRVREPTAKAKDRDVDPDGDHQDAGAMIESDDEEYHEQPSRKRPRDGGDPDDSDNDETAPYQSTAI